MHITRMAVICISLLVFSACMNLGRSASTATRFYLLESKVEPIMAKGSQGKLANISLGVGPVNVAAYLDRPQLTSRLSGAELRVDEFNRWAEPLEAGILRVTQENLSVLTDGGHVHSHPYRQSVAIDYQITLDVLQFGPDAAGSVTLKSVWRIVSPDSDQRLKQKHSTIVQPSTSTASADMVDAMSMALAALSNEITQALVDGLAQ